MMVAPHFAEYSLELSRALARRADVMLWLNRRNLLAEMGGTDLEAVDGLTVRFIDTSSRLARLASSLKIMAAAVLWRPRAIHFQESNNPLTTDVAPWLARFFPLALTIHDPTPHVGRDSIAAAASWRKRLKVRQAAAMVFGHGGYCVAALAAPAAGGLKRVTDAPHGPILSPSADQQRAPEPGRLLMFGRMEHYKGLSVLIDAVDILEARGIRPTVVIAGQGPSLTELRPRLDGRANIVVRDGWISRSEAIEEFQRAAVVVAPYLEATQSGVVAAAFANGRPVVASRAGGLPDVVTPGLNGLLVEPGDARVLADALERFLTTSGLYRQFSEGALRASCGALSWDTAATAILNEYMIDS